MTVAKSSYQFQENVQSFVSHFGIENCGLLTLTFSDDIQSVYEASKRFNSFRTGFLSKVANAYIGVYERTKRGRIHFHFVVAFPQNILWEYRNGRKVVFNHERVKKRDYRSRNQYLGQLWKQFREAAVKYGFGDGMGTQIIPLYDAKGVGKYLAKYLSKGIKEREHRDKGFRLVRSTSGKAAVAWKKVTGAFSWNASGAKEWRLSLEWYLQDLKRVWAAIRVRNMAKGYILTAYQRKKFHDIEQMDSENYNIVMAEYFGKTWCYDMKENIWDSYQKFKADKTFSNALSIERWREIEAFENFLNALDKAGIGYQFTYQPE